MNFNRTRLECCVHGILSKSCILVNAVTKNVSKEADSEIKITDSLPLRFEAQILSEESAGGVQTSRRESQARVLRHVDVHVECKNAAKVSQ